MVFHNHAAHATCVASLNNYHSSLYDLQDTLLISGKRALDYALPGQYATYT